MAGASASKYLMQQLTNGSVSGASQRLGQLSLHFDSNQPGKFSVEWGSGGETSSSSGVGDSVTDRQAQNSAAPVISADKNTDAGKNNKNKIEDFKVPDKEFTLVISPTRAPLNWSNESTGTSGTA